MCTPHLLLDVCAHVANDVLALLQEAAQQGATAAPEPEADVDLHFVAFVEHAGRLFELDGRKSGPIDHGPSSPASLLSDVAGVVRRNFVDKANSLNFSLIALAAAGTDD